jgi:hypothetical protein
VAADVTRPTPRWLEYATDRTLLNVSEPEKAFADSLHIANYTVYLLNKYGRDFLARIENPYDFINRQQLGELCVLQVSLLPYAG